MENKKNIDFTEEQYKKINENKIKGANLQLEFAKKIQEKLENKIDNINNIDELEKTFNLYLATTEVIITRENALFLQDEVSKLKN